MAKISAARTPLNLYVGDGNKLATFQMSPLTDRDFDELDEWVQTQLIDLSRKSLPETATRVQRQEVLQAALDRASTMSWADGSGMRAMMTPAGRARIVWQGIHTSHPEITEDTLRPWMRDSRNFAAIREAFDRLNGLDIKESEDIVEKKVDQE